MTKKSLRKSCRYVVLLAAMHFIVLTANAFASCSSPANPIEAENCLTGNPSSQWDVSGAGDQTVQGFATDISFNKSTTGNPRSVSFKINTPANAYTIDIYRMGYYAGMGARLVASILPSASLPQTQPACMTNAATKLYDCGNWAVSASWAIPTTATSGIYFAKLTRPDTGGSSHIFFIIRDDSSHSSLLFQTSDETWQAYNDWANGSLYGSTTTNFDVNNRAFKVSYNRPFHTRVMENGVSWVFNSEYPMVRWLEANGYDVTYFSGMDTDRNGSLLLQHKVFMSVGHDEYWSGGQRANVEAARAGGVHLAFFSGNEIFWKTRWENSIDGTNTPYRTLVCYKETHANSVIDPQDPPTWTGTWRDTRFSPPADGGRPENALSGTIFMVNGPEIPPLSIKIPAADGNMRFWRSTTVAGQPSGQTVTLPAGSLGFEWDIDADNGFRPAGLFHLSTATYNISSDFLLDFGSTYGSGTATHNMTLYRAASGALAFSAGSIQWSWGLDAHHDAPDYAAFPADIRMQQATVNLFADMGVQPASIQGGLVTAIQSIDSTPPDSTVTSPTSGATLQVGVPVTISGTAADTGGGVVGGVEVSVDGGTTWHPAVGRENWTYSWTTSTSGSVTIRSRAADDSGNLENPSSGVTVTVGGSGPCCSGWGGNVVPGTVDSGDPTAGEYGVKFRADVNGSITAVRFYKSSANTGTHDGHLWNSSGTLLASVTFTNESSSGWQQATFSSPVAVVAGATYIASYFAPIGHYSFDSGYFATSGVDNPPLHFLGDGVDGPNGVYAYSPSSAFPTSTFNSSNYWVDVVFTSGGADTTPPTVMSFSPPSGSTTVNPSSAITATFSEAIDPTTINGNTFQLLNASNAVVSATVTYNSSTETATLQPSAVLANSATYSVVLRGGSVDPRIKDLAGNAMTANVSWAFTTATPPSNDGPGGPILVISSTANPFTRYYGEILRAEGLNEFLVQDISGVSSSTLAAYDVVILGDISLTSAQVSMLTTWVNGGGRLIAMHPDKQLAGLLGLNATSGTTAEAYILVNTATGPGAGIVGQTMQYHGVADMYTLNGASSLATLYSSATTPTTSPALTLVNAGAGQAAAFTYDLARSIVYTRQGNPAWSGQARDGQIPPIRPDDLFFGNASFDPEPDWVDLNKVAIPQADEQQRLLANLILQMNSSRKPLPRFWYFPSGFKAVVVMTGDDHGSYYSSGHTIDRFNDFLAASTPGCSVADWQCIRESAYLFPQSLASNPLTDSQAAAYIAQGFEVGVHVDSVPDCSTWTRSQLESFYTSQLASFASQFPSVPAPRTHRMHCVSWSDYDTEPQIDLEHGIRLDTTYYYWPPSWVNNVPGVFTGSGMPMRLTDRTGNLIDVYEATTQMTDESGQTYPFNINVLLGNALGSTGYYGAFVANMHNDDYPGPGADAIVAAAQANGVPVVSSLQMLTWIDGRNSSSFGSLSWNSNILSFTISAATGARNLRAMVPTTSTGGLLTAIVFNGSSLSFTTQTIKGVQYASFNASSGSYQARYGAGSSFSISGTISGSGGNAATVTLSGTASATTTADSSGNYTFTGLLNGAYTVTPSKTGFTFAPASQNVTVNGSNVTATNFTSTALPTFSISGTISGSGGNAATVTLSGTANATTTANSSGNYTLTGLLNGAYTVTPGKSGFTFNPASQNVSVSSANVANVNFTSTAVAPGTLIIDATAFKDNSAASTSITSPSFSTASGNELLLAFVGGDNPGSGSNTVVNSVTGGGLTWVLVGRTNVQFGTSEIWRAFASSGLSNVSVTANFSISAPVSTITVVSFTGVDISGTNGAGAVGASGTGNATSGGPTASLVTTRNNSLVFGVGNDWDSAAARTPGPNQSLVHQYLASNDDTYWVQRQNAVTALSGTTVTINDTAPTTDRYNLQIVEILPATGPPPPTFTISGAISGSGGNAATLALSGTSSATATSDATGNYSFPSVVNGSYTVTPSKAGFIFTPVSQNVTVSNGNVTAVNFTSATAPTFSVSGTISGTGGNAATVALSGAQTATTTADASGNYTFITLVNGAYTVTPTKNGFTFTPANQNVSVSGANVTGVNFTSVGVALSSVTLNPSTLTGGSGSTGTVTLNGPAPTGGALVTLSSGNAAATVPASVTVAAGAITATFAVATSSVASNTSASITGTYGVSKSATLTINAATLSTLTRTPTSVVGGNNSTGTVTLTGKAPSSGAVVNLTSSITSVAQVPATVTVPSGATSATFTITTSGVASSSSSTISAIYAGVTRTTTITATVATLSSLTLTPSTVTGGNPSTATLTLNGAAPPSGAVVSLRSSNILVATVPISATVSGGAKTVNFTVTTTPVHGTSATISGTYRATTRSSTLTVQ
jgi:Domain of unknown function (DUF4082)/Bacterial Ig-like domain/Bacterial Ig domain